MLGRVFILDDQPMMAGTTALMVAIFGYEAVQCHHPKEAVARLLAEPFDALVTDYEMPAMTGLAVVQKLRDEGCMIPAVVMSGNVRAIDLFHAEQLGIAAILEKPFPTDQLREALRAALV